MINKSVCDCCGKSFCCNNNNYYLTKHERRERKFCSEECAKKSVIIKKVSELTCLECGKKIGVEGIATLFYGNLGVFCCENCLVKYSFKIKKED